MDNFIDTCIILSNFDKKDIFYKLSNKFIEENDNLILSFYQKNKEIPYLIWRIKIRSKIIKLKALSPSKEISEIDKLTKTDKIQINKVISNYQLGLITIKDLFNFQEQAYLLERKINSFLKTRIKRFITPLDKINDKLVHLLFRLNKNKADSEIISSAIREHQKNQLILVTTDKNDWKQEYITKACKDCSYDKIPEVKFLQD